MARTSRSPHVSAPRRRLPTGTNSVPGAASRRWASSADADVGGVGEQVAARVPPAFLDRLEDQRFLLRPHPLQLAKAPASRPRSSSSSSERDVERPVEQRDRLRAHALQAEDVEERGREFRSSSWWNAPGRSRRFRGCARPGPCRCREVPAARPRRARRPPRRCRPPCRRRPVRADLERVLALDLEQVGDLREHPRDGLVIHDSTIIMAARSLRPPAARTGASRPRGESVVPTGLHRRIGQLAIIGFDGFVLPPEVRSLAREFDLGGVLLFKRNVESPEQVAELAWSAQQLAGDLPLWVAVDQEGGRVARMRAPLTEWPPMATLGRANREELAGTLRAGARGRAGRRRLLARLRARPRRPDQSRRTRSSATARWRRRPKLSPASARSSARASGRRHRRVRQALSRAWRHVECRLAPGAADSRPAAGAAPGGRAPAVPRSHRGGCGRDHHRPPARARARRSAACDALARDRRPACCAASSGSRAWCSPTTST